MTSNSFPYFCKMIYDHMYYKYNITVHCNNLTNLEDEIRKIALGTYQGYLKRLTTIPSICQDPFKLLKAGYIRFILDRS